jgi:type II secretory ATPase GspE/PulE/Tfp pilus assembly ATPase PilB-like protein
MTADDRILIPVDFSEMAVETVRTTGKIAEAIQHGVSEDELRRLIRGEETAVSLTADALLRARDGVTSIEEARGIKWA